MLSLSLGYIQKKIERETTRQKKHAPARASKERETEREREKARHVGSSTPDDADTVPVDDDDGDDDEREKTDDVDGVECFCARDKKPRNERKCRRRRAPSTVRVVSEGTGRFIVGGTGSATAADSSPAN